ncbi:MAG: hypothetical protein IPG07_08220 [Crocinitomicaceae bacterium]|nr:hypothetical protein [Crocinitomicaceae bacterium]
MKNWFIIIAAFWSIQLTAQDKIDPAKMNYDLLNQLVTEEINALRDRKRLDTLQPDQTLEKASDDHAKYMSENQVLTHAQKSKSKRTPYDRVVFYGGTHNAVGENIQAQPIAQMYEDANGKLTYQKLAKEIAETWKSSKEHYETILNPEFQNVAYAFYAKDGILYVCQVLGSKPFIENYAFDKGPLLPIKNKDECGACKRTKKIKQRSGIYWLVHCFQ